MANYGQIEHAYPVARITNGSNISDVVNASKNTITGFIFPIGFEGATITLMAAASMTDIYYPVKDPTTGSALTIQAGASAFVPIHPSDLSAIQFFKIVSATPVAADRAVVVIMRPTV